jgi:hypothetical protein
MLYALESLNRGLLCWGSLYRGSGYLLPWNLCMEGLATALESQYGGSGYCLGISVWRVRLLPWNLCMEGQTVFLGSCAGISV